MCKLGPREVFGEKALLEDTHRTATRRHARRRARHVACRPPSDGRKLPILDTYFEKLLAERTRDPKPAPEARAEA